MWVSGWLCVWERVGVWVWVRGVCMRMYFAQGIDYSLLPIFCLPSLLFLISRLFYLFYPLLSCAHTWVLDRSVLWSNKSIFHMSIFISKVSLYSSTFHSLFSLSPSLPPSFLPFFFPPPFPPSHPPSFLPSLPSLISPSQFIRWGTSSSSFYFRYSYLPIFFYTDSRIFPWNQAVLSTWRLCSTRLFFAKYLTKLTQGKIEYDGDDDDDDERG